MYIFDLGEGQLQGSDTWDCGRGSCKMEPRVGGIIWLCIPSFARVYLDKPRTHFVHHPLELMAISERVIYAKTIFMTLDRPSLER